MDQVSIHSGDYQRDDCYDLRLDVQCGDGDGAVLLYDQPPGNVGQASGGMHAAFEEESTIHPR